MNATTEAEALAYLQNAFSELFSSSGAGKAITSDADTHTALLARQIQNAANPENEAGIPVQLTGIRQRYLESVHKNAIARKRYEATLTSIRQDLPQTSAKEHANVPSYGLSSHLELLREQKRHEKLGILEHYLTELENLNETLRAENGHDSGERPGPASAPPDADLAGDVSGIEDLLTQLKAAVIQSDSDAKRENAQLMAAKARAGSLKGLDAVQEAQALIAVRDELTQWLEQSLAQCTDNGVTEEVINEDESARTTAEDVEAQYEEYLRARQRVLNATERLKAPLSKAKTKTAPVNEGRRVTQRVGPVDTALASEAQQRQRLAEQSMEHVEAYLAEELDKEKKESFEGLLRLVDESQLLPQYPVLAKDERFGKIIGSLGGRSQSQLDSDDKFTEQIEAWAFAADAADKSLEAAVNGHVTKADKALDEVDELLRDLRILCDYAG